MIEDLSTAIPLVSSCWTKAPDFEGFFRSAGFEELWHKFQGHCLKDHVGLGRLALLGVVCVLRRA